MTSGGECAAIYAMGSWQCRCSTDNTPPSSLLVTVLPISDDAPGHLGSALTAHHTASN